MSWHQTIVVGRVGGDPRFAQLPSGTNVCNLNLAVNESWTDRKTNEKREKVTWYRVSLYDRLAEIANTYVHKGTQVMIIGTVEARAYMDNNGQPAGSLELRAREMKLLGNRSDNMGAGTGSDDDYNEYGQQGGYGNKDMDDIPF